MANVRQSNNQTSAGGRPPADFWLFCGWTSVGFLSTADVRRNLSRISRCPLFADRCPAAYSRQMSGHKTARHSTPTHVRQTSDADTYPANVRLFSGRIANIRPQNSQTSSANNNSADVRRFDGRTSVRTSFFLSFSEIISGIYS